MMLCDAKMTSSKDKMGLHYYSPSSKTSVYGARLTSGYWATVVLGICFLSVSLNAILILRYMDIEEIIQAQQSQIDIIMKFMNNQNRSGENFKETQIQNVNSLAPTAVKHGQNVNLTRRVFEKSNANQKERNIKLRVDLHAVSEDELQPTTTAQYNLTTNVSALTDDILDKQSNQSENSYKLINKHIAGNLVNKKNKHTGFNSNSGDDSNRIRIKRASEKGNKNRKYKDKARISKKKRRNRNKDKKHELLHLVIDVNRSSPGHPHLITKSSDYTLEYWKLPDADTSYRQRFANYQASNGSVTIKKTGLYMIYSQLTYFDRAGRWSHQIEINNQAFVKCLASEWGVDVDPATKKYYNTVHQCYTSGLAFINKNSQVHIRSLYADRVIHQDETMTFWGILKLD